MATTRSKTTVRANVTSSTAVSCKGALLHRRTTSRAWLMFQATMKRMAKVTDMFSIWVVNKSTNEKTGGTEAFFKKPADNSIGAQLSDRSFEVQVLDYTDD